MRVVELTDVQQAYVRQHADLQGLLTAEPDRPVLDDDEPAARQVEN